jgi:hypothetical protein
METILTGSTSFSAIAGNLSRPTHGNNINTKIGRYYFSMQDRPVAENKVIIPNAFHKYLINPRGER